MGLLSWLVAAGRDTISQIVLVWLVTTVMALAHLPPALVGMVEVLADLFACQGVTWAEFARFFFWTTLGNAIGGAVLVALLKTRPRHAEQFGYAGPED